MFDFLFEWVYDLLYTLQKSICYLLDFIVEIFYKLAGIETVNIGGKETDLLSHFVLSGGVRTAFLGVMLIGIVLLCIFVIIAILRSETAEGQGKKTKGQILGKAFQSFVIFLIIPFMLAAGILLTNTVMGAINGTMTSSLTGGGGNASIGGQILVTSGSSAFTGSAAERAAIEQQFITGQLDYNSLKVVKEYYDLSEMNFFVGIASGLVILIMFILAVLKFVQRIFDIVLLYIISPVSVATIPTDDGQRFKIWREMLISKVLGAYGIILSMNLFFLIIPQVSSIGFFGNNFKNGVVSILFIIGGSFAVTKANLVIAQLTGNNAGAQESQQMMANITTGARLARATGHGVTSVIGQTLGGGDFKSNQRRGASFSDNMAMTFKSTRNQHLVEQKNAGGEKKSAAEAAGQVATGAFRLATLPVGVLKDLLQGGAVTAGKNIVPRIRNVISGSGVINRADVVKKHAEKAVEKSSETVSEKTEEKQK